MSAQWYDGMVAIPGCDKNMPGVVIAMGRLNRPSIMVYGGTIRAGEQPSSGESLDIVSAFQSFGAYVYDKIDEAERLEITRHSCPGQGACGGMYTANTMATAIEALGMSLPYVCRADMLQTDRRDAAAADRTDVALQDAETAETRPPSRRPTSRPRPTRPSPRPSRRRRTSPRPPTPPNHPGRPSRPSDLQNPLVSFEQQ